MPMPPPTDSRSDFLRVRGLRYHIRRWGDPQRPMILLGHGWLDVSATFQPLVQPLLSRWQVIAPDWRGFGHTQWPQDGYWFQDYLADCDAIVAHYSPLTPIALIGHSMSAQILSLYAGLRPDRVSALACLDGLFLPDMGAELAPKRAVQWLDQIAALQKKDKSYDSHEVLARRIRIQHPQLSPEKALFIAQCWGQPDGFGRIRLLADPKHHFHGPALYRAAESMAIWIRVTAPTLFLDAGRSQFLRAVSAEERERRLGCFRERETRRIEEAGHMLHFDAPVETGALIADFLARRLPPG
jgi:pimeloyl-ACP methyl ester carboxylesterase